MEQHTFTSLLLHAIYIDLAYMRITMGQTSSPTDTSYVSCLTSHIWKLAVDIEAET